jgi:hypothetical protein
VTTIEERTASGTGYPGVDPEGHDLRFAGEVAQLRHALATRTVIGQATGIVGVRLRVGMDTAWEILRRASTDTNTKVRRVAQVVVSSHDGTRPAADDEIARQVAPILGFDLDRPADRRRGDETTPRRYASRSVWPQ